MSKPKRKKQFAETELPSALGDLADVVVDWQMDETNHRPRKWAVNYLMSSGFIGAMIGLVVGIVVVTAFSRLPDYWVYILNPVILVILGVMAAWQSRLVHAPLGLLLGRRTFKRWYGKDFPTGMRSRPGIDESIKAWLAAAGVALFGASALLTQVPENIDLVSKQFIVLVSALLGMIVAAGKSAMVSFVIDGLVKNRFEYQNVLGHPKQPQEKDK